MAAKMISAQKALVRSSLGSRLAIIEKHLALFVGVPLEGHMKDRFQLFGAHGFAGRRVRQQPSLAQYPNPIASPRGKVQVMRNDQNQFSLVAKRRKKIPELG